MPRQRTAPATSSRGRKSSTAAEKNRDGNARQRGGQVSYAELVKLARKGVTSHTEAANELGLPTSSLSMLEWMKAQVEVGAWDEIPATEKAVRNAKDNDRNRWELIAARAGVSVQAARDLYGDEDDVKAAAIRGRGANGNGESTSKTSKASKTSTAKATTTRGRAKKDSAASAAPTRARTLAERRAANRRNPS